MRDFKPLQALSVFSNNSGDNHSSNVPLSVCLMGLREVGGRQSCGDSGSQTNSSSLGGGGHSGLEDMHSIPFLFRW